MISERLAPRMRQEGQPDPSSRLLDLRRRFDHVDEILSLTACRIFTTVLITRTTKNIGTKMPAALATTGISTSAMTQLITAISTNPSGNFSTIPDVTSDMAMIGLRAYQDASSAAFGTVFLSTIAFSGISAILAIWSPNVNHKLTKELSTPIQTQDINRAINARGETVEQKV
jgi:hypothetical protein